MKYIDEYRPYVVIRGKHEDEMDKIDYAVYRMNLEREKDKIKESVSLFCADLTHQTYVLNEIDETSPTPNPMVKEVQDKIRSLSSTIQSIYAREIDRVRLIEAKWDK